MELLTHVMILIEEDLIWSACRKKLNISLKTAGIPKDFRKADDIS